MRLTDKKILEKLKRKNKGNVLLNKKFLETDYPRGKP